MTATTAVPLDDLAQRIAQQQSELEALRREYEARQTQLANLQRRKEELESLLGQVETQMRALAQGNLPKSTPSAAKQGASSPTLPQVLVEIVGAAGRPMTVKEIATEVVRRRFPTTSRDIPNLVCTRVKELVKKGSLCQANGQPGVVLGTSGNGQKTASPAAKRLAQVGGKNGAVAHKQAQRTKPAHRQGQPSLRGPEQPSAKEQTTADRVGTGPAGPGNRLPDQEQEFRRRCLGRYGHHEECRAYVWQGIPA